MSESPTDARSRAAFGADYDQWLTLFASRKEVAEEYATLLSHNGTRWLGWHALNAAILRRWSPAGLEYIKRRAWKIATQDL